MTVTVAQARTIARLLREAAQAEILPRFRNLSASAIREKSSALDLVTDADVAAEKHITAALHAAFPEAVVVGEEATAADPSLTGRLRDAPLAILVDPIDGTKNFSAGLPLFGVMAAVVAHGEVVAGVIHDPIVDDWALAVRGVGAWVESLDGRTTDLRVSKAPPLAEMAGMVSWLFMREPLRSTVTRNLTRVASAVDYRTAAHEYRLIAAGRYDFLAFGKLMPWDHAPGWLLHREAGGYAARFDGTPYRVTELTGELLCAPDEASWHALRDALLAP